MKIEVVSDIACPWCAVGVWALDRALAALQSEAGGLPQVEAALDRLRADRPLAWRAYAAGLLGEELAE